MEASALNLAATSACNSHSTMSSSMLKKLIELRLGDECCSLKCKQEKENMRTAIMKLADAFNDIFDTYVAQDRMLAEIIKIANGMCTAFNLPQRFSVPNEGCKNRLYDMARMVRLYHVKNPHIKKDARKKTNKPNSAPINEFTSPVKTSSSGNASLNNSGTAAMRNGNSNNRPTILTKRNMPSNTANHQQPFKRTCAVGYMDHNYSQPQAQPLVRRSDGIYPAVQVDRNNVKTWNPPVERRSESNGAIINGIPPIRSNRIMPGLNGVNSTRIPVLGHNNILDPNFPTVSKDVDQNQPGAVPTTLYSQNPLAQLQKMYIMPAQRRPQASVLPTISSTTSTTDCSAIKQQLNAGVRVPSTLEASPNVPQLVTRVEEGPPGGCKLYILSGYQRRYLANVPILFGSDIYTNLHSLTLPRLRLSQVNKEVPEVSSLNAKMQYDDGGVCVVKLIVKYSYTGPDQKLFLYYYLTEAQAQGVGQWDNGKDFKCRETGTMTVTLQFEDITENEVLMLSFRLGSAEKGISPYSTPVALKLGEASSGSETNVDYEHFRQREKEAQSGERSANQNTSNGGDNSTGVEVIDLED